MGSSIDTPNSETALRLGWPTIGFIFVIFIAGLFQIIPATVNHDASWLLYMAQQTLAGSTPYVDQIETNPPLIIWLSMPPALIAQLTGITIGLAFKIYVFMLAGVSITLCAGLIRRLKPEFGRTILMLAAYSATLLSANHFGQREHFLVILSLPYVFMVMARAERIALPIWQIILVSILAAIGFCIKPYFVLVPAVLELYLLAILGWKTLRRPEPYIMMVAGLTYLAAIFAITPQYISHILGYAAAVYNDAFQTTWYKMYTEIAPLIMTIPLGLILMAFTKTRPAQIRPVFAILILTALALMAGYFIQFKGWSNHAYPIRAIGAILLILGIRQLFVANISALMARSLMAVFAFIFFAAAVAPVIFANYRYADATSYPVVMKEYPEVKTIFIMSAYLYEGFPLVTETDLIWGSRFNALWLTPGLQLKKAAGETSPFLDEIEAYTHRALAEDFAKYKPELIFVDITENKKHMEGVTYDYIEDYSQDPQFAAEWAHYQFIRNIGGRALYKRR
jgi:hypothetical protein